MIWTAAILACIAGLALLAYLRRRGRDSGASGGPVPRPPVESDRRRSADPDPRRAWEEELATAEARERREQDDAERFARELKEMDAAGREHARAQRDQERAERERKKASKRGRRSY
ncbi:hypothetical protein [Glycomyces buryatensis]|uniref:Uncharacterized protein n=1 Tax=Glycomyces buryatensis TaxID=2570927 RepID=A0A4S8QD51_9ACTN|nr:hypothetical protein [Glycomyces buryatensis]THV41541.1 hypothetical protein FAB82_10555 [Glycomyces buryatensis]